MVNGPETVSKVLHYLAASGHSIYAKSARICLVYDWIENDHPDVSWMDIMLHVTVIEHGQDFTKIDDGWSIYAKYENLLCSD